MKPLVGRTQAHSAWLAAPGLPAGWRGFWPPFFGDGPILAVGPRQTGFWLLGLCPDRRQACSRGFADRGLGNTGAGWLSS